MPGRAATVHLFLPSASAEGLNRLQAAIPDLVRTPIGLAIPLGDRGPEEILSLCLRCGVTARATRIVEPSASG
jgi:hypothetical protein